MAAHRDTPPLGSERRRLLHVTCRGCAERGAGGAGGSYDEHVPPDMTSHHQDLYQYGTARLSVPNIGWSSYVGMSKPLRLFCGSRGSERSRLRLRLPGSMGVRLAA